MPRPGCLVPAAACPPPSRASPPLFSSNPAAAERLQFIRLLQDFATSKRLRVSILSGDAHVGGVGRLYTHHPKIKPLRQALGKATEAPACLHSLLPRAVPCSAANSSLLRVCPPASLLCCSDDPLFMVQARRWAVWASSNAASRDGFGCSHAAARCLTLTASPAPPHAPTVHPTDHQLCHCERPTPSPRHQDAHAHQLFL